MQDSRSEQTLRRHKLLALWRDWADAGRVSLHGGVHFESKQISLALTTYPSFLDHKKSDFNKISQAHSLSGAQQRFWETLAAPQGVRMRKISFRLPEVALQIPLPAPRAMVGSLSPLAGRRLKEFLAESCRQERYEMGAVLFPLQEWPQLLPTLAHLLAEFPGAATPPLATLVEALAEFRTELLQLWQEGQKEPWNPAWDDALQYGNRCDVIPSWDDYERGLTRLWTPVEGVFVPALPLGRCRHWVVRCAALNARCLQEEGDPHAQWGRAVVAHALAVARETPVDLLQDGEVSSPSLAYFAADFCRSRPWHPAVGLVCESMAGVAQVRLSPVVFSPEAQGGTAAQTLKNMTQPQNLVRLSALVNHDSESSPVFAWRGSDQVYPGGRLWGLVDLVRFCEALPGIFCHPTLVFRGDLTMNSESFALVRQRIESRLVTGKNRRVILCDYFENTLTALQKVYPIGNPLLQQTIVGRKSGQWWDREAASPENTLCGNGLQVEWLDWAEKPLLRLGTSYEISGEAPEGLSLAGVQQWLKGLRTSKRGGRPAPSEQEISLLNLALFEARPWFEVNGEPLSLQDWGAARKRKGGYLLPNGVFLASEDYESFTEKFLLRSRALQKMGRVSLGALWRTHLATTGFSSKERTSPEEYLRDLEVRLSPVLQEWRQALAEVAHTLMELRLPPSLLATLRPYQKEGVAFLYAASRMGLNLCLADEMGLGKTLQAIAFLWLLTADDPGARCLVVVPKSVLYNWRKELARFAPHFGVAEWGETGAEAATIVLVTYTRARLEMAALEQQPWAVCVIDEAHTIKNSETKIAGALKRLGARVKVALTGTPIENRVRELWSLVDWLNPGYLGKVAEFERYANLARSSLEKKLMLAPLHTALEPILLRRTKGSPQVALNLPEKIFEEHLFTLSPEQEVLYAAILESVGGVDLRARASLLKALMHLKQVCDHPEIFVSDADEGWLDDIAKNLAFDLSPALRRRIRALEKRSSASLQKGSLGILERHARRSAKVAQFIEVVRKARDQSTGIVIFTQFVSMGKLILDVLQNLDEVHWNAVPFLQGSLSSAERMTMVENFNHRCRERGLRPEGVAPILVASLKAGGLGLNLAEADTVIHFDRWWNPAVEDQATDRLHRMGQKRTVMVHLFTALGTIEESIARLMQEKRALANDFLDAATAPGLEQITASRAAFLKVVDPDGHFCAVLSKSEATSEEM